VTRKDLAKAIAEEMGLTHLQAAEIIQCVIDGSVETVVTEGRLELRNFGVFEVKKRKPRIARHPRTGESGQSLARNSAASPVMRSFSRLALWQTGAWYDLP
jgi:nucleoid DNA-binding protein